MCVCVRVCMSVCGGRCCVCECVEGNVDVCVCVCVCEHKCECGWVYGMDMGVGVDRYSFGMMVYVHLLGTFEGFVKAKDKRQRISLCMQSRVARIWVKQRTS